MKHTCNIVDGSINCRACAAGIPYPWNEDPGKLLADELRKQLVIVHQPDDEQMPETD